MTLTCPELYLQGAARARILSEVRRATDVRLTGSATRTNQTHAHQAAYVFPGPISTPAETEPAPRAGPAGTPGPASLGPQRAVAIGGSMDDDGALILVPEGGEGG